MSKICKSPPSCKSVEEHQRYISRITKTLYYGKLPKNDVLSLPATELAAEFFSEVQKGRSLHRLHLNTAAQISRSACVSPCSLVLAMVYFERLKKCNMEYLENTMPSDLFLVSLMVSSKFLFDDGESDEVFMDEWASSSGITGRKLAQLERQFLQAIDWKLFISEPIFWNKLQEIEIQLAFNEGISRGHFTYTELELLGDVLFKDFCDTIQIIVAVSAILAGIYLTSVLSICGSVAIVSAIPGTTLHQSTSSSLATIKKDQNNTLDEPISVMNPSIKRHNFTAADVFKTSLLLASITGQNSTDPGPIFSTSTVDDDCQNVGWDWWNVPIMCWLAKTSDYVISFEIPIIRTEFYYLENTMTTEKFVYLEDHKQQATETRIQDQLEQSWHVEWTDSIKKTVNIFAVYSKLRN